MNEKLIIIDIGSTTTKGLLLQKENNDYYTKGLIHTPTTVEKPVEDVTIGLKNAVSLLEKESGLTLWENIEEKKIRDDVSLYCTSSAGGGLQILVIGLTTFDSAASGKRCAYGAGAVILDTFAINDSRSAVQQMKAMSRLHPDLVLMTGGTDGGAVAPVVRLAELLQFANPRAKFSDDPIPLIFAGNVEARDLIKGVLKNRFQLNMVDNVRPSMKKENHQPARDLIHDIFMNYVMEQAPGYSEVVKRVDDDIIPTPLGVLKSIEMLHNEKEGEVMMVDIGGATTDVFSNMHGEFYRTVSANYGMSYSISNVYKDAGWSIIRDQLPAGTNEDYVRNYIADKMLFPTCNPQSPMHYMIEHIMARSALFLAREQHLDMNFNTDQVGFLDKIVNHKNIESIVDKFYFKKEEKQEKFFLHDYLYAIGAGGVISHSESKDQALMLIADGLNMQGLTKIYRDKDFTSPHLGKLSQIDKNEAEKILYRDCLEELGWHIRPQGRKWKSHKNVLKISYDGKTEVVATGKKYMIAADGKEKEYIIEMEKNFFLNDDSRNMKLTTNLPVYIDTTHPNLENDIGAFHQLYDYKKELPALEEVFPLKKSHFEAEEGEFTRRVFMPYVGEVKVDIGAEVAPDMVVAENRSNPPRLYIITLFDRHNLGLAKDNIHDFLLIKEGDVVKMGQKIVDRRKLSLKEQMHGVAQTYESPLRGLVENINYDAGTIILREVQDYSDKPIIVKISNKLGIKPELMQGYLKVRKGDFVYSGDLLAAIRLDRGSIRQNAVLDRKTMESISQRNDENPDSLKHNSVLAPATGSIVDIDNDKGTVTIMYDREPLIHYAGVTGTISDIRNDLEIDITYRGFRLQGIIGFGKPKPGKLLFCDDLEIPSSANESSVLVLTKPVNLDYLKKAGEAGIAGVIAPSIHYGDLKEFIGSDIGVALTGNEPIKFPLILMQGFGHYDLPEKMTEFLRSKNGCSCFVDGHTQIRAGVTRPQIIIQD